jgi:hypothetical protein
MRDPLLMAMCLETLFPQDCDPHLREGAARILGRALRALIVAHEVTPKGDEVRVIAGPDNG